MLLLYIGVDVIQLGDKGLTDSLTRKALHLERGIEYHLSHNVVRERDIGFSYVGGVYLLDELAERGGHRRTHEVVRHEVRFQEDHGNEELDVEVQLILAHVLELLSLLATASVLQESLAFISLSIEGGDFIVLLLVFFFTYL